MKLICVVLYLVGLGRLLLLLLAAMCVAIVQQHPPGVGSLPPSVPVRGTPVDSLESGGRS